MRNDFRFRWPSAARRAHARAMARLDIEQARHPVLDLSDADLAELACRAIETPQAQADLAGIGIRPAPCDDGDRFDGLS